MRLSETKSRIDARDWQGLERGENGKLLHNGSKVSVLHDEKVLEVGYTTV